MTLNSTVFVAVAFISLGLDGCNKSAESDQATQGGSMRGMPGMPATATPRALPGVAQRAEHMAHGKINSIDNAGGTVNISHDAVASANWPAMTMTFKLSEPGAAANLKLGQQVDFEFTIESGMSATVTKITPTD